MGSKRELLEEIEKIVDKKIIKDKAFLDLFAGTCGVGIYLRDKYPVYSCDVQLYSKYISQGTIETGSIEMTREKIWSLLEGDYTKNYNFLSKKLSQYLLKSSSFKKVTWNSSNLKSYTSFIKTLAFPEGVNNNPEAAWLTSEYKKQNKKGKSFPYVQTTFLFSEMYFSLEQAIIIDSIKYAIDNLPTEYEDLKRVLNVALIHSYSYNSAGTGHFAQFRDLTSVSSVKDVFIYRIKSVTDYFLRKTEEIIEASRTNIYHEESKSFAHDYRELLTDEKIMKNVGLVYADPPYTFVHYSRFYHAIENLCRYDYPIVEHKGRYRTDRHQSPFCIKTQAPDAFKQIFVNASKYKVPVLISYSNTGMIELKEINKIAEGFGYKTDLLEIDHKHSTMGRLKDKDRDVKEALLLCH